MKLGSLALWAVAGAFVFVVYAAFSPVNWPSWGGGVTPDVAKAMATGRPVLLEFSATWCGPCQMVAPDVESLAREVAGRAEVVKVDVDEQRGLAAKYGVRSIPCFVVVKDGREVERRVGAIPKSEMRRMLGL